MHTVAGLDNGIQSRFEVGPDGRQWLQNDLAGVDKKTPIVIFSTRLFTNIIAIGTSGPMTPTKFRRSLPNSIRCPSFTATPTSFS